MDLDFLHGSSKQGESLTLNQEKLEIVFVLISLVIIIIMTKYKNCNDTVISRSFNVKVSAGVRT